MPRTFRVAVLECDTTIEPVRVVRGLYGEVFRSLLAQGLDSLDDKETNFEVSRWDVVGKGYYPKTDDFDGLLLSGSKHTAFQNEPWIVSLVEFVQGVINSSGKPVVGICFGHQIIARALGAKVGVSPGGWEISVDHINLNEEGQKLLGVPEVNLHQMHRDAVLEVPENLLNLGSSPSCGIQGLYRPGRVLSFQAHPEFDDFIMTQILHSRHDQGIFDDGMFKDGMGRAENSHDGVLVSRAICRFFLGSLPCA